jgi:hypothetical protein
VTGPWIYCLLQEFIYTYFENNKQIPYNVIKEFVSKYYKVNYVLQESIAEKLFVFQHDIIDRQNYRIDDYQYDQYDNQFVLYKHKDYTKYEDCGEIWVRQKNYALSVPLMNYARVFDSYELYQNDIYDTLQCDEHIDYANMWKQLCNNAIKFGVFQNTLWVLGYTKYLISNGRIFESEESSYLKVRLCSILSRYNI